MPKRSDNLREKSKLFLKERKYGGNFLEIFFEGSSPDSKCNCKQHCSSTLSLLIRIYYNQINDFNDCVHVLQVGIF